eukprot:SM000087S23366  [mRNA]  locus=s87:351869:356688:+ [translate_table: standard]
MNGHANGGAMDGARAEKAQQEKVHPEPPEAAEDHPLAAGKAGVAGNDRDCLSDAHDGGFEDVLTGASGFEEPPPDQPVALREVPPRRELLDIVRKHSDMLPRPGTQAAAAAAAAAAELPQEGLMDERYWQEMVDMFFLRADAADRDTHFDDMLFFVRRTPRAVDFQQSLKPLKIDGGGGSKSPWKPFFVRRRLPDLMKVMGGVATEVDWQLSYYLNLIAHTAYTLTVAVCSRAALDRHRKTKGAPVTPMFKVTKRVYASPSRARIDMEAAKALETVPAYPDICFAVDDYDNAFDSVVLSDPDHCFCVLLNAHGGAAIPPEEALPAGTAGPPKRTSSEAKALGEAPGDGSPKVTLFSGCVGYPLVRASFQGVQRPLGLFGKREDRAERLVMRGPGGRGEADVAVSRAPPSHAGTTLYRPFSSFKKAEPSQAEARPGAMGSAADSPAKVAGLQRQVAEVQTKLLAMVQEPSSGERQQRELQDVQRQLQQVQEQLGAASLPPPSGSSIFSSLFKRKDETRGGSSGTGDKHVPLRCCLMSLSLPWDSLAYDLLFKDLPVRISITGSILPRPARRDLL